MSPKQQGHPFFRFYRLRGRILRTERTFLLPPGVHRLGSALQNDLVVPVSGISRKHARLTHHVEPSGEARLEVEDLGSRNGTFVNGDAVRIRELLPGDVVGFGPVELRLEEIDSGDAELALFFPSEKRDESDPSPAEETTACVARSVRGAPEPPNLVFPQGHVPGRSRAMTRLYRAMESVAGTDLPVLIAGETGVGKESIARTIHLSSRRRAGPLVAINCAAIPSELLEAEMFGIGERVATGVRARPGRFRQAAGGTVFLDEIGDMPAPLQAKLLRVLQEKEIQPVGEAPIRVDTRIVAATNVELLERVDRGEFRRDLYFRIAGVVLRVPPLRARRDDLPDLAEFFLRRTARAREEFPSRSIRGVTVKALELLSTYDWPGNIRELEHEIERLVTVCPHGEAIDSTMLGTHLRRTSDPPPVSEEADSEAKEGNSRAPTSSALPCLDLETLERQAIAQALRSTGGNQVQAARLLGITRSRLRRRMERYGLQRIPPSGP